MGASVVAWQVHLLPEMLASPMGTSSSLGKTAQDGPNTWATANT